MGERGRAGGLASMLRALGNPGARVRRTMFDNQETSA
jgi:hypothetical protein